MGSEKKQSKMFLFNVALRGLRPPVTKGYIRAGLADSRTSNSCRNDGTLGLFHQTRNRSPIKAAVSGEHEAKGKVNLFC